MVSKRQQNQAFTLIELLVVISVISLLIAILLPSLGRAKEQARRAICLSNLKEVHKAFYSYAQDNNGIVPIGYRSYSEQLNSMVYSGTAMKFVLFGLLYQANFIKEPRIFYCPTESNPQSMYNSPGNPWPPGVTPTTNTYAGYETRPAFNFPDDWSAIPAGTPLPKLWDFTTLAIFADLTAIPDRVNTRHVTGVNVLYGDGGANWVGRPNFDGPLSQCTAVQANNTYNTQQSAIWTALDQH